MQKVFLCVFFHLALINSCESKEINNCFYNYKDFVIYDFRKDVINNGSTYFNDNNPRRQIDFLTVNSTLIKPNLVNPSFNEFYINNYSVLWKNHLRDLNSKDTNESMSFDLDQLFNKTETIQPFPRSTFYLSTAIGLVLSANINYEIHMDSFNERNKVNFLFRFSLGGIAGWETWGPLTKIGIQGLTGMNNNHFEFGLGLLLFVNTAYKNETFFLPTYNIGYRFQKPTGGLFYRVGLGLDENIYFSIGWAFPSKKL